MNEEWRPVQGFEGFYNVSSHGRIQSLARVIQRRDGKPLRIPERILKTLPNSHGYERMTLFGAAGLKRSATVHSLVAKTFLPAPPGPLGTPGFTVNHRDGVKTNNHISNLEYITSAENILHARSIDLIDSVGEGNPNARVTDDDVRGIRSKYSKGARQVDLADEYGVDQTSISKIVLRRTWSHVK